MEAYRSYPRKEYRRWWFERTCARGLEFDRQRETALQVSRPTALSIEEEHDIFAFVPKGFVAPGSNEPRPLARVRAVGLTKLALGAIAYATTLALFPLWYVSFSTYPYLEYAFICFVLLPLAAYVAVDRLVDS